MKQKLNKINENKHTEYHTKMEKRARHEGRKRKKRRKN
jgi:hypothetical protein